MNDHDLLVRIDERVEFISKSLELQNAEIDNLKKWKNSMTGGLSILIGLTGYTFVF